MTSSDVPDRHEAAAAVLLSVGRFWRWLRLRPVQDDLSVSEISALTALDRAASATPVEPARIEQITPQGMGAILAELEQAGLVARDRDPSGGRRVVMTATEAGQEVVRRKAGARIEQLVAAMGDFTAEELEMLMAGMGLLDRLGEGI